MEERRGEEIWERGRNMGEGKKYGRGDDASNDTITFPFPPFPVECTRA